MKIIDQSAEIMYGPTYEEALSVIEKAGRTCYKSEDKITEDSAEGFVGRIINTHKHLSVIEHIGFTVRFICDRAVSHELVRHRLCSFSQESQRYVDLNGKDIEFIRPFWMKRTMDTGAAALFIESLAQADSAYKSLRHLGLPPQAARGVLPNATKTEIVTTANMREWRHVFSLRCDKAAHPDMVELMNSLLAQCKERYKVFFADLSFE